MKTIFQLKDVSYREILQIPNLEIQKGITGILGGSGSGKSTLLRLLNKMISPTMGQIFYQGRDLAEEDSVLHRREVGMLSQQPGILPGTILDNLFWGFRLRREALPEKDSCIEAMEKVQLFKDLNQNAQSLSGGEKQRLALARILLLKPRVILLDEPTSALDEALGEELMEFLSGEGRKEGQSLILVSHNTSLARRYSHELVYLESGKLVGQEKGEAEND